MVPTTENKSSRIGVHAGSSIALKSYRRSVADVTQSLRTNQINTMKLSTISYTFLALGSILATVGCQTQQQMVQSQQGMAVETALNRARFDMNCPSATGTVLSTNVSQPSVQGRFASAYGVQRFEYTVGVTGCGQRRTYIVICPQGGGCFAAPGRR
jgi:hypothetical protein